jgi:hypothetical protein
MAVLLKLEEFEKWHRQFHDRKLELTTERLPRVCSQPLKTCRERKFIVSEVICSLNACVGDFVLTEIYMQGGALHSHKGLKCLKYLSRSATPS